MNDAPTRNRLIETAAQLFRLRGYSGVGLSEILVAAGAPKGSLYHHFPEGKSELARYAAQWIAEQNSRIIDEAFAGKTDWREGVAHYFGKLARLYELTGTGPQCPLKSVLFDGPEDSTSVVLFDQIMQSWIDRIAGHCTALGLPHDEARRTAETVMIASEGGWSLARARKDASILRGMPARIFGEPMQQAAK